MIGRVRGRLSRVAVLGMALLALAGLLALGAPVSARQAAPVKRIAWVITDDASGADVAAGGESVRRRLGEMGFTVTPSQNAGAIALSRSFGAVEGAADADTVVFIYFSGVGLRVNNADWLLGAGAAPQSVADLPNTALNLGEVIASLRAKGALVVVVLDGCHASTARDALGAECPRPARQGGLYLMSAGRSLPPGDLTRGIVPLLTDDATAARVWGRALEAGFDANAVVINPAEPPALAQMRLGPAPAAPVVAQPPAPVVQPPPKQDPPPSTMSLPAKDLPPDVPPAQVTVAPTPPQPPAKVADADAQLGERVFAPLKLATAALEAEDVAGARRQVAGLKAELDRLGPSSAYPAGVQLAYGQVAYVEGRWQDALTAFAEARRLFGSQLSEGGRGDMDIALMQGTASLRAGQQAEAVRMLTRARDGYLKLELAEPAARARVRLGEAYRGLGQRDAARAEFNESKTGGGQNLENASAFMNLAQMAIEDGDWEAARNYATGAVSRRETTQVGLADAYAALGRAQWKLGQTPEPQLWETYDKAAAADPRNPAVEALARDLPTRMLLPPFETMRPPVFRHDTGVEGRAMACYVTAQERDDYLKLDVQKEMDRLKDYIAVIDAYKRTLDQRDGEYQLHGYNYHFLLMNERDAWDGPRGRAVARLAALDRWYRHAAVTTCKPEETPTRLAAPVGYDPAVGDGTIPQPPLRVGGGPGPAIAAPAPPVQQAVAPPPVQQPVVQPPPQQVAVQQPAAQPVVRQPVVQQPVVKPPEPKPQPPVQQAAVQQPPVQQAAVQPPPVKAPEPKPPEPKPQPPPVQVAVQQPKPQPPPVSQPVTQYPRPQPQVVSQPPPRPVQQAPVQQAPVQAPAPAPVQQAAVQPPPAPAPAPVRMTVPPPALIGPPPAAVAPPPVQAAVVQPPPAKGKGGKPAAAVAAPPAAPPKPTKGPAAAAALIGEGEALLARGKPVEAGRQYLAAREADPGNVDAEAGVLMSQGLVKLAAQQPEAAVADLEASVAKKPLPEALEALGRIYAANDKRNAAIGFFGRAIDLRPSYFQAYYGRAEAYRIRATPTRNYAELALAVADYRSALAQGGAQAAPVHYGLGAAQFYTADYAGAVESFNTALKLQTIYPDATYARARAYLMLDRPQDAMNDIGELSGFDKYAAACTRGQAFYRLAFESWTAKDFPAGAQRFAEAKRAYAEVRPDKTQASDPGQRFVDAERMEFALGVASKLKSGPPKSTPFSKRPAGYVPQGATLAWAEACRKLD